MKKARIKEDIKIMGYGVLKAGTVYEVTKSNTRNVYVRINAGCVCRLPVKAVEKVR